MSRAAFLFLAALCTMRSGTLGAKAIKNKLFGDPKAFCGENEITVMIETELPFSGNVYAKGFFDKPVCRVQGDGVGNTVNITVPINSECGMRRKRTAMPRGISLETTVVLMFHRMFLTKADKAFHIDCSYEETNELYTQSLQVSMLPTTDIPSETDDVVMSPKCSYEVLSGDASGPPLSFAAIGQPVYHHWKCQTALKGKKNMHCLTVHSCVVDDGQGLKQQLLDDDGCPIDTDLLDEIEYLGDLEAGRDSFVFKFADKPTVFFSCQLRVQPKDEHGKCMRTSDFCEGSSISPEDAATTPLSIEHDFPRPSTPIPNSVEPEPEPDVDIVSSDEEEESDREGENSTEPEEHHKFANGKLVPPSSEEQTLATSTTTAMRKRRTKTRRPVRGARPPSFPDYVALQRDLVVRRKPSPLVSAQAVELDVTAGSVEVVDMPETGIKDGPKASSLPSIPSIRTRDLATRTDEVCLARFAFIAALFGCACFVLLLLSAGLCLFWKLLPVAPQKEASMPPQSDCATLSLSRSIMAFEQTQT